MPRTTYTVCSGICLLFTTALAAQVLPKHPTPQQIAVYRLQQQREWNLRQLPANSVLFRYTANYRPFNYRLTHDLPAYNTPYGFSIKQSYGLYPNYRAALNSEDSWESLEGYLERYRTHYANWLRNRRWTDPAEGGGYLILRDLIYPQTPYPPGGKK